jgi:hypothetical protein
MGHTAARAYRAGTARSTAGRRSRHFQEYGTCVFAHTVMRRTRRLNMLYPPDEAPAGAPRRSATAARLMASTPMASFREAA